MHHFAELINRDWCGQRYHNSEEEYKEFEENHQYGIIKPLNLCGGEGIKKFELSKIGGYKYCKKNKCLIEEEIIQHDIN